MKLMECTDEKLFNLCKKYGHQAKVWRQRFAGLLPEVYQRELYKKKGFTSIFEFAAKLGGMSKEHVKRVLSLDDSFQDKPLLRDMLQNGKVSIHKLARIASIATPENQDFLANQVRLLPQKALKTLARDERLVRAHKTESGNQMEIMQGWLPRLSDEVKQKFYELHNKGIDINKLLLEFLEKREIEIAEEKERLSREAQKAQATQKNSRYIPAKIKKLLQKEHGTKCSLQTCQKPAEEIHHTQRFSLTKTHDPCFLAPLCHEHHTIAHTIDMDFHRIRQAAM